MPLSFARDAGRSEEQAAYMNTGTEEQAADGQEKSEQERPEQDFGKLLRDEFSAAQPKTGDLCKGVIIEADEAGLLVDFGFKREGFVPAEDLVHLDEGTLATICPGAEVAVFVVRPHTRDGQPELSIQQAQQFEYWLKAEEMLASNGLYEGEVAGCNRGGLIVKYGDIRGFVPTSQVVGMPRRLPEEERRRRLETMVGRQIGLRIIEVDRGRRRLIFSQRRAYREWQERRRHQTMAELTEGETRRGRVTDLTSFGAFVDLGGADGLVHVSELSWRRVNHPREVLTVGQEVDVYVLGVDRQRKRIALSLKRLQPDPWTVVDEEYHVGQLTEGRVTRVLDFGAFVALDLGVEGLLHVSEMIGTPDLRPSDVVQPNDSVVLKIIRIESDRKRIGLSAKQVRQSEWERWMVEQQAEPAAEQAAEAEAAVDQPAEPVQEPIDGAPTEEPAPGHRATAAGDEAPSPELADAGEQGMPVAEAELDTAVDEVEASEEAASVPVESVADELVTEAPGPDVEVASETVDAGEPDAAKHEEAAEEPEAEAAVTVAAEDAEAEQPPSEDVAPEAEPDVEPAQETTAAESETEEAQPDAVSPEAEPGVDSAQETTAAESELEEAQPDAAEPAAGEEGISED